MQVKVYVPTVVEIPNAYVPALARRASETIGDKASDVSATRGHLVRQAVQDGLLRQFDDLICEDGSVDLVCDPATETPLELQNKTLSLSELLNALQSNREWGEGNPKPKAA
ncbi:MAG: hypothetical protein JW888_14575 [Pirellulales bacterium]|nr:hypothetical protein [Pirellulales bacterium]